MLPLGLVLTAPLFNYLGHGVETALALLGTLALTALAIASGQGARAWRVCAGKGFITGAALVVLTIILWGYSSFTGISPHSRGNWAEIPLIVAFLTLFGVYARAMPLARHQNLLATAAFITVAIAAMVLAERAIPALTQLLHGESGADRLNFTAPILIWGLPFTLHQWRRHTARWWMPILTVLAIGASNGRIGWVVAPVVMALYTAATWKDISPRRWLCMWGAFVAAIVLGMGLLMAVVGSSFLTERLHDLASGSGEGRIDIWRFALAQWWQHAPWFGIGVQGFRYLDFTGVMLTSTAHPHNGLVQLLLETGLVGTIAATATLCYLVRQAWRAMAANPQDRVVLLLCFAGVDACSLASTSLFHGWWMVFMLTPLAWALAWPPKK